MLIIEVNREDLYSFCRKISFKMLSMNEHIDFKKMKERGRIKKHEIYKADLVVFIDDDGSKKILRSK